MGSDILASRFLLTRLANQSSFLLSGTFLINAGNIGTIPGILAWVRFSFWEFHCRWHLVTNFLYQSSNNVVSHSKRIVQSAITVMFGGVGGILATATFRVQDAPRYIPG
jgi:hypothetical protein